MMRAARGLVLGGASILLGLAGSCQTAEPLGQILSGFLQDSIRQALAAYLV